MSIVSKLITLLLVPLPSLVKVTILRIMGHTVGEGVYIGFSYLGVEHIKLGDDSYIGHGNIFTGVKTLTLGMGARISRWNRFTSVGAFPGAFLLGDRSAVTLRHYFDCAGGISIGSDTIIAGHKSTFFSHSKGTLNRGNYAAPIEIGPWCYIGSNVCVVPGVRVYDHCFVGMGAVLVGDYINIRYALLGGNPAKKRKDLEPNCGYFSAGPLVQPHLKENRG